MTDDGKVTCPKTRSIFSHKREMKKMQQSPAFKKMKAEHALIPGAICAHCKRQHKEPRINRRTGDGQLDKNGKVQLTSLTINHLFAWLSQSPETYLTWDESTMEVCCSVCNGFYRKGQEVCPVCGINPINAHEGDRGMCLACYHALHPEIKEEQELRKAKWNAGVRIIKEKRNAKNRASKRKHPCRFRMISGKCQCDGHHCEHAPTKAEKNCGKFEKKKTLVKNNVVSMH